MVRHPHDAISSNSLLKTKEDGRKPELLSPLHKVGSVEVFLHSVIGLPAKLLHDLSKNDRGSLK